MGYQGSAFGLCFGKKHNSHFIFLDVLFRRIIGILSNGDSVILSIEDISTKKDEFFKQFVNIELWFHNDIGLDGNTQDMILNVILMKNLIVK